MKKIIFLMVLAVAFCTYVPSASANGIVEIGPVSDSGTGFGHVSNILTLQNPSFSLNTEIGSISWNGETDVLGLDAKQTSQTWLFSEIIAKGIVDASQLGIVYNVNQEGNQDGLTTTLNYFYLNVFSIGGTPLFSTTTCEGCGPNFVPIAQGTGGAGYLFVLDDSAVASLGTYFADPTQYRLGATGSVSLANDGPDNFFFTNVNGTTPVPEPGTMMLLGSGLVGLAGWGRKKFRK